MGGSSGGGGGGSKDMLRTQRAAMEQQMAIAGQMKDIAMGKDVTALAGQGLTPAEQMQMSMVDAGKQGMEEQVRNEATARGLFSSAGAIAQEGLIPMQLAQQKADIYGNAQQRQFQGLGLQQGFLGNAIGGYGSAFGSAGLLNQAYGQQQQNNQSNILGGVTGMAKMFF